MQKHRASKHKQLQYHSYAPTTARSNIAGRTTPHNAKARRQMVAYNNAGSSALGMKNNTRQLGKWAHKHGRASEKFPKINPKFDFDLKNIWFDDEKFLICKDFLQKWLFLRARLQPGGSQDGRTAPGRSDWSRASPYISLICMSCFSSNWVPFSL